MDSDLILIGEGRNGKVYRLNDQQCLKVYNNLSHLQKELRVLQDAQRYPQFPRLYFHGENYMIRAYCPGPNAKQYLREHGFTPDFAAKLLELLDIFKELNFTKLDCRLTHIIVTEEENLQVIDPARSMGTVCAIPKRMLKGLTRLGYADAFLRYVQQNRPDLYASWQP